jgi:sporulation-control protein
MSFLNRMLASIGIGSAKADTLLERSAYRPGDEVRGVVRIKGGQVAQRLDRIYLSLMTYYVREINDQKVNQSTSLMKIAVSEPMEIRPNEERDIPFAFDLPARTPLTMGRTAVWIKTTVDIEAAVDPTDEDRIVVEPNPYMETVFSAFEQIGFRLRNAETIYAPRFGGSVPFVQEFEWTPTGAYRGKLDEVELVFLDTDESGVEMFLQVDRKARDLFGMFAEAMDTDESFVRIEIGANDLRQGPSRVADLLNQTISKYA